MFGYILGTIALIWIWLYYGGMNSSTGRDGKAVGDGNNPQSSEKEIEKPKAQDKTALYDQGGSALRISNPNSKSPLCALSEVHKEHSINSSTIRVISILPTLMGQSIQCTMRTIPLSQHYEALSYECNPPRGGPTALARLRRLGKPAHYFDSNVEAETKLFEPSFIFIDGYPVQVPWNLHSVLWHIRDSTPIPNPGGSITAWSRTLWVDALCISQEADGEKEREIKRMKDIYSKCAWVLIWLGEATEMSDRAMDWFNRFFTDFSFSDPEALVNNLISSFYRDKRPWNDFAGSLLNSSYWTRLWTVQEIALAPQAMVICGSKMMRWDRFLAPVAASIKGRLKMYTHLAELPAFTAAAGIRTGINPRISLGIQAQEKVFPDIRELAARFSEYGTSLPHDRIFALLGLAKDANTIGLNVSYQTSISELYTEFSRANISKYRDLDFIFSHRNLYRNERLPSWVLDLDCPPRSCVYPSLNRPYGAGLVFKAAGNLPKPSFRFDRLISGWALSLEGIIVDEFTMLGESYLPERSNHMKSLHSTDKDKYFSSDDYLRSLELGAKRVAYNIKSYLEWQIDESGDRNYAFTNQTKKVALSQTMCYGLNWEGYPLVGDEGLLSISFSPPASSRPDLNYQARCEAWQEDMWMWRTFYWTGRKVARSQKGYMGLVPEQTRVGDKIVVALGASEPLVLRPKGEKWTIVGSCYVHGIMKGEASNGILRSMVVV